LIRALRGTLVASGLSAALLMVAASSASAVVFSPPSIDFGHQPRYTTSLPQTFTLTKETQFKSEFVEITVILDRYLDSYQETTNCPVFLTATIPSCIVTVRFTPFAPGTVGGLITTGGDMASTLKPTATFTGTGTKPCIKKKQHAQQLQYKKKCKGFRRYLPKG
jgi:hypothetical protein